MTTERTKHPTDPDAIKPGDIIAVVHYCKVVSFRKGRQPMEAKVQDLDRGGEFDMLGRELFVAAASADHYAEEVTATKTRVAEILTASVNRPFTVCFDKQDGTERTLRGRLVQPEPLLGRSLVEDLDVEGSHRQRLVDHRTLKWLIVDGVKYTVK